MSKFESNFQENILFETDIETRIEKFLLEENVLMFDPMDICDNYFQKKKSECFSSRKNSPKIEENSYNLHSDSFTIFLNEKNIEGLSSEILNKRKKQKKFTLSIGNFKVVVSFRTGIFVSLVCRMKIGKSLGIMISASHNPVEDNGFKVSDFTGGMIRQIFEKELEVFTNEKNLELAIENSTKIIEKEFNEKLDLQKKGLVFLGCDTRPSSPNLISLAEKAVLECGCFVKNFGEVTTPQLHFFVWHFNSSNLFTQESTTQEISDSYYKYFVSGFKKLVSKTNEKELIVLDAANGIGGTKVVPLLEELKGILNVELINKNDTTKLNDKCGSEYVQKEKEYPLNSKESIQNNSKDYQIRCLSFDGDADRIVYFLPDKELKELILLDGDKISGLFALFVITIIGKSNAIIEELQKEKINVPIDLKTWSIGAVQTAYANGSSTDYFKKININVKCCPSGIKNLHHEAVKYDIGIYFESNGHGTMLIKNNRLDELEKCIKNLKECLEKSEKIQNLITNLEILKNFLTLANQAVGDAISVFLMIEAAFCHIPITVEKWEKIWEDLPSKTTKVKVLNRNKIKNTWDHTRVTEPKEIQNEIDEIVKKYDSARAFLRPSGTEDVVRLYVEGKNLEDVEVMRKAITEVILQNKTIN